MLVEVRKAGVFRWLKRIHLKPRFRAHMRVTTLSLALGASALLHLAALVAPGWHLPEDEDLGGHLITATLLAAPVAETPIPAGKPARVSAAPKKKRAPPIVDAPTASLGEVPVASAPLANEAPPVESLTQSTPVAETLASAPVPEAQSVVASAEPTPAPLADLGTWSRQGRVRYVSSYMGIPITGEQVWSRDDTQFSASLRGSVPIKGELIKQESSGRILAGRPVSDNFRETFNAAQYETHFDPAGNKVQQVRKGAEREVDTGGYALDMLALTHFMALQPVGADNFDVFVVTFRGSVSRVTIEQRPAQQVELPLGSVYARQFHAEARNGSLKIDVWLSVDWSNAPLRIRVQDSGGTYDLKAEKVEVDGVIVGRSPVTPVSSD